MSLRLYEIPEIFERLEALLLESGGELTPDIEAVLAEAELAGTDKIEAAWAVVKNLEVFRDACKEEGNRLLARGSGADNAITRLKAMILPAVTAMGGKVKTTRWTVFTTTRKGMAFDVKPGHQFFELPGAWLRMRDPELNKTAIKEALERGDEVPDALVIVPTSTTFVSAR